MVQPGAVWMNQSNYALMNGNIMKHRSLFYPCGDQLLRGSIVLVCCGLLSWQQQWLYQDATDLRQLKMVEIAHSLPIIRFCPL